MFSEQRKGMRKRPKTDNSIWVMPKQRKLIAQEVKQNNKVNKK